MNSYYLRIKNWKRFQHYSHRKPPWIKLHRELLDDYQFHRLSDASRALAPMLWLLASEREDGMVPLNPEEIAFRLRGDRRKIAGCLQELELSGFISFDHEGASDVLAACKQNVTTEKETETELEAEVCVTKNQLHTLHEKAKHRAPKPRAEYTAEFLKLWQIYPRTDGKYAAFVQFQKLGLKDGDVDKIIEAVKKHGEGDDWTRDGGRYIPHLATYLHQRRFEDEFIDA